MHYFLIAGEASGDLHGGLLIQAIKQLEPQAIITFLGGDAMAASGEKPLIHYRDMAYMGFVDVARHLPQVLRNLRKAKHDMLAAHPDALILIDYPSFNLKVAEEAAKAGIPIYYFIPPKVWAWKKYRLKAIKRLCTKVLSILPFEPDFYAANGAEAVYVGNPSVAEVDAALARAGSREDFLRRHNLRNRPLVALMPGSRAGEIRSNLQIMTKALDQFPQYRGVIVGAPGIDDEYYAQCGAQWPVLRYKHAAEILPHCEAALVTSGTATLEAALAGTPQVALYRGTGSKITYKVMEKWLEIPYVTLPNLIAGEAVIPELLMHLCTADAAAEALAPLLTDSPARAAQLAGYAKIRQRLGTNSAALTAAKIITAR